MKRDGRSLAHDTLEAMRVVAVQRMRDGEHPEAVAESFGMNRSWAYKCRAHARGRGRGLKALRSTKASGRPRKLTTVQERQVLRWMNGKRPDQHGFDVGLWTRPTVQELLATRFDVHLSLASIGGLFSHLGISAPKPLHSATQRDPEAVALWRKEAFPTIVAEARANGAELLFWADAAELKVAASAALPDAHFAKQRPPAHAAFALNSKGAFWYATHEGGLTGEVFVELLARLLDRRNKPVHLVVDGHLEHKKPIVKNFVAGTGGKLVLHFLPSSASTAPVRRHAQRAGKAARPSEQDNDLPQAPTSRRLTALPL